MGYLEAIILGIVQGFTEFLPVSSSGHLVLFQNLFGLDPESDKMIFFDLIAHLGTVAAIFWFYRIKVIKYFRGLMVDIRHFKNPIQRYHKSGSARLSVMACASIFGTAVIYLLLHDCIKAGFGSMNIVAGCWLITATLLLVTDQQKHVKGSLKQFALIAAVAIGVAQGLAMFPGISRSGSTICVAVLLGLRREWAAEFSFLIGVPVICGAALLDGIDFFTENQVSLDWWGPTLAGCLMSAITGFFALRILVWALKKSKLKYFAIYLYILGFSTLLYQALT